MLCTHPTLNWSVDRTDASSPSLHEVNKVSAFTVPGLELEKADITLLLTTNWLFLENYLITKVGKNRINQTLL